MTNAWKIDEATPRPWKFSPWHVEEGCSAVRAPAGHIVCTTASDADAKYIARAVNAYDPALQDKLTKAVKALEQCATPFTLPNIDDLSGDALEKSVAIFRCLVEHALAVQTAANTVLRSIKESE